MASSPRAFATRRLGGIRWYLVSLTLIVALPLALLSLARIATQTSEAQKIANREALRLARLVSARVDERIRTADALLLGLSVDLTIDGSRRSDFDSLLARALRVTPNRYANLYIADSTGTLIGSAQRVLAEGDTSGALSAHKFFTRARGNQGYVVGDPVRSTLLPGSPWIVALARPIRDGGNHFRGVVGVSLWLDSLSDVVSTSDLPGTPQIAIVDTTGLVIAESSNQDSMTRPRRMTFSQSNDSVQVGRFTDFDGQLRVASFTKSQSAPWLVNVGLLQSEATAAARSRRMNDFLLFNLTAGLAILVAWLMAQQIARPIRRLTEDANALTRGVTEHRTSVGGPLEIRFLGEAFNQMADTLQRRNLALADSERRYRLLFDSNPLPMWAWDADSRAILAVNEAAIEHYGYNRDKFLSLEITDLLAPSEMSRFKDLRLPFLESRQAAGVWVHKKADGTSVEMEIVTTSSRRLGRASWLSVGIDITARRAAERALTESEEQLRQSQKMEAIGAFAGGIAHDFNNLLTGMLGYCDLALGGMDSQHEAQADIEEVRNLALRGADLTRQILAVGRKQVVQPTYVDPNEVIRGLMGLLRRVIGEDIAFTVDLTENPGSVFVDAGQLEQVLLNLAGNARDAMPTGGSMRIQTRPADETMMANVGLSTGQKWIELSIEDTGTGMNPDVRERIFEPFFTTKERGKGTGLGLALAYAMVAQAGGHIRVDTEAGVGSTFHLYLPQHEAAEATVKERSDNSVTLSGTETILIAEDEDSVRAVATAALASRGYNVLAAPNGESALKLAAQYPSQIHLLLTDVVMPGMNGRELAEAVLRERPDIKVLFASGYMDDASLLRGIRIDEVSFVQKPFLPSQLVRRVRLLLDAVEP